MDGTTWYWPAGENPASRRHARDPGRARLLAPFDPVVWDRRRFEQLWGWAYRFEAYTPAPQRKLGYYAQPLLWGDQVVGWGNCSVKDGVLEAGIGVHEARLRRDPALRRALRAELDDMVRFLGLLAVRWDWLMR